jgi:hypothetical protein
MPVIRDRFATFHGYASADLAAIYSSDRLAAATRLTANELASGVLINNGAASFTWRPLPAEAQLATCFGAAAGDFDGDGHTDLALVQNQFSRDPESGIWAGGLGTLLRGDGRGGFAAVSPARSGLIVPGDGKALAVIDIDGDNRPDLLAAQNDGRLLAFRGGSGNSGGGRPLALRLSGGPGNPDAVGARVTVEFDDGTRQMIERHAGGGYLSQSTATLFVTSAPGVKAVRVHVAWPDASATTHEIDGSQQGVISIRRP